MNYKFYIKIRDELQIPQTVDVITVIDSSEMRNYKKGVAFCVDGIYWKNNTNYVAYAPQGYPKIKNGKLLWEDAIKSDIISSL